MEPRTWNVGVLIGSLRKASFSRKLALALRDNAPSTLRLNVIEIGAMPLYNYDDEPVPPEPWLTFRQQVKAADALLFVTPEYNRSIPSALKNAIDVGSRPKGNIVWDAKPAAVISLSPEAYVGGADKLFGDDGSIVVEPTRQFLDQFMRHFAGWIDRFKPAAAA